MSRRPAAKAEGPVRIENRHTNRNTIASGDSAHFRCYTALCCGREGAPMPMIMMQLGGYQFHVDTAAYQRLQRVDEYRWATMERIIFEPTQQWIGIGTGTYQIEAMRAEAAQGTPLPLVDGRGNFYGMWCILSVEEEASDFVDHGGPRKQGFTVKLIRQGEGQEGAGATAAGGALAAVL